MIYRVHERRMKNSELKSYINNFLDNVRWNAVNLFEKVKCKGFYKPFKDGRWLYLDRKTLTADAMDNILINRRAYWLFC